MKLFSQIPPPPRATGGDPGPVTPQAWNRLVDFLLELERRVLAVAPKSGPDIGFRPTPDGMVGWIKRRGTQPSRATAPHPFKIETAMVEDDLVLRVNYGAISSFTGASSGDSWPLVKEVVPMFDAAEDKYLLNDPFFPLGAVGGTVLAANTTYGIWLELEWVTQENPPPLGTDGDYDTVEIAADITKCKVVASTTKTYLDSVHTGATNGMGFYLGMVVVDPAGAVSITQHRRSDIVVPAYMLPIHIVHPEEPPP